MRAFMTTTRRTVLLVAAIAFGLALQPSGVSGQSPRVVYDDTQKTILAVYDLESDVSFCSQLDAFEGSVISSSTKEPLTLAEHYSLVLRTKKGRQTFNVYLNQLSLAQQRLVASSLFRKGKKLRVGYQTCGNGGIEYVQNLISLDVSVHPSRPAGSLTNYEGRYPFDLLRARPQLKQRLRRLLGKDYQFFITAMTAQEPIKREGQMLVLSGCFPHRCGAHGSIMLISLDSVALHCAIVSEDYRERYKIFSEERANLPPLLLEKIQMRLSSN
jgi:hypothetical protein